MIHLLLMSVMIYAIAPFAFGAKLPNQSVFYFISLIIFYYDITERWQYFRFGDEKSKQKSL